MPSPAVLAMPGAIHAAKHVAMHAAACVDVTALTSATFAAILAQWLWKRLPVWIKEDISFRNLLKNRDQVTREELSHLGSVVDKLQELANSSSVKADIPQLHAAVLAYIQLSGQLKLAQIENQEEMDETLTRDHMYQRVGRSFPIQDLHSAEFQSALDFSTWAYYDDTEILTQKLEERGYILLAHNGSSRPGNVAYYVAVSPEQKQVLVGIRGTSTLEELLTDCCGRAIPLQDRTTSDDSLRIEVEASKPNTVLAEDDGDVEVISGLERIVCEDHDEEGDNFPRCHEGILISARRMVDKIQPILRSWIRNGDLRFVLCGHSLGAGAATLAALILRSRFPELDERIQVYAFAPPPVLDHDSAIAAASFCTSVVHNADMIPRCSLSNLAVFVECLRAVHERLAEKGMNPTGPLSTAAFVHQLSQGTNGELLLTASELNETVQQAHDRVALRKPEHLYIPGRVLLVYNPWTMTPGKDSELPAPVLKCIETDGTAAIFRTLEVDGPRLFTDHVSSSYYEAMGMDYQF
jgi:hypothetical protein